MPYRYKTLLAVTVNPQTGCEHFECSRKLPLWGQYWVEGYSSGATLVARYRTDDHLGYFIMTRTCCDDSPCGGRNSGLAPVIPGHMLNPVSDAFSSTLHLGSRPQAGIARARTVTAHPPNVTTLPDSRAPDGLPSGASRVASNPPKRIHARPSQYGLWPRESWDVPESQGPSAASLPSIQSWR